MFLNVLNYKLPYIKSTKLKKTPISFGAASVEKDITTFTSLSKGHLKFFKGTFGIQSTNSTPLQELSDYKDLKGFSTPPNNVSGTYLYGNINIPLSTSGVHNCTALAVSNSKNHIIYHASPNMSEKQLKKIVNKLMGKDFDKAYIILGHLEQTEVTATNMLKALRKINPKVKIEFKHFSSPNPEIISYRNNIYGISTNGKLTQASFDVVENLDYCLRNLKR